VFVLQHIKTGKSKKQDNGQEKPDIAQGQALLRCTE
jgi:hypothetical protein